MYHYPLKFKAGSTPADAALLILDADKNEILFRPRITEAVEKGTAPCIIYTDKTASLPLCTILSQKNDGMESFVVKTPGDAILGKLVAESEHAWKVLDEHDNLIATIQEKGAWKKSCLVAILTLPFDDDDFWFKIIAPHRFSVKINGKEVLALREVVSNISDDYNLKKHGEFSERQETLLLVSLMRIL